MTEAAPIKELVVCSRRAGKTRGTLRLLLQRLGYTEDQIQRVMDQVFPPVP